MDTETEVIREQIEQTRGALQEKIEALEQQVQDTVQGAADAAAETVQTVKQTVEAVKESVQETTASIRQSLDLAKHVREHPCLMFFGAMGLGFAGTRLLLNNGPAQSFAPPPDPAPPRPFATQGHRNGKSHPSQPGFLGRIGEHYHEELSKLEGLAIGAVAAIGRELVISAVAPTMAQQINEIVDGITRKLGGTPIQGPLLQPTAGAATKDHQEETESKQQWMKSAGAEPNKP